MPGLLLEATLVNRFTVTSHSRSLQNEKTTHIHAIHHRHVDKEHTRKKHGRVFGYWCLFHIDAIQFFWDHQGPMAFENKITERKKGQVIR